jgi:hypothetical protein
VTRLLLFLTGLAAALGLDSAWTSKAQAQGTEPVYFYCYAANLSEGVVYVSDVHKVGPFSERAGYGPRFEQWLRASGRLGDGKGRCVMRATMREIERGRQDLPVSGCFDCNGPMVYRDIAWPFGDGAVESTNVSDVEPPRQAMSASEEAALDKREQPETRPGTTVYGRIDLTDALFRSGSEDSQQRALAATKEKGGKWYPVTVDDRCPGWAAVAFAQGPKLRRYFIGRSSSEAAASAEALSIAAEFAASRSDWETGLLLTYFNDTVEVDDRSLSDKSIDAVKGWIRSQVVDPNAPRPKSDRMVCVGVRG